MAQNNVGYSSSQIIAMQNDAIRRVNEMQRIAKEKLMQTQQANIASPPPINRMQEHHNHMENNHQEIPIHMNNYNHNQKAPNNQHKEVAVVENSLPEPCENGFEGILQRLNLDNEKIMIILLLILLINEGSDIMLILALVYILL